VNILVTESGKACLADFGLSNHVDAEMLTWTSESSANTGGTVRWQAPEFFDPENENSKSTKETDVYAFSCVCYEVRVICQCQLSCQLTHFIKIFTCQVPFHEISREPTVIAKVMGGKRPSCPAKNSVPFIEWGLTDAMWGLMQQCWDRDPENRPTMSSISGKAFLSSLVDDRPSGGAEALSPPQFRGAMHGFL
jgi:serine/threonine protein kinase